MLKRFILLGLGVYGATIPLPNNSLLPEDLRLRLYNNRPYFLIALFLVAIAERVYRLGSGKLLPSPAEFRALTFSLLFPAYYLIVSLIKGTYNAPVAGLYVAWSLFSFLLAPTLMRTVKDVRVITGLLVVINLTVWVFSFVYERITDVHVPLVYGGPYGYISGDYFAQVVLVVVAAAFIYVTARDASGLRWKSWQANLVIAGFIGAAVFVGILAARSAVAFLAIAGIAFMVLRRGHNVWVIHALLLAGTALMVYALAFPENQNLDAATSDRLSVWNSALQTLRDEPSPPLAVLTGTTDANLQTRAFSRQYDPLSAGKAFSKFHVDNSFLELVLEGGMLGLALFLLPYGCVLRAGLMNLRSDPARTSLMATSVGLMVGIAFLSLTTSTIPTFNSPIGFFTAFFGALPAIIPRLGTVEDTEHSLAPIDPRASLPAPNTIPSGRS